MRRILREMVASREVRMARSRREGGREGGREGEREGGEGGRDRQTDGRTW
jgi:hypothetical protein